MAQTLYLVRMFESADDGDLGPSAEIVVQLSGIDGKWFRDFRQNSWAYANIALLQGLKREGLRLVASLPNLDPHRPVYENSFWIVTESLDPEGKRDADMFERRRDAEGY